MKFYSDTKELSVFNRRKKIADFTNGEFKTDDPIIIEKLKPHFKYEEESKTVQNFEYFRKIKKEASDRGINTFKMGREDIENALRNFKEKEVI